MYGCEKVQHVKKDHFISQIRFICFYIFLLLIFQFMCNIPEYTGSEFTASRFQRQDLLYLLTTTVFYNRQSGRHLK